MLGWALGHYLPQLSSATQRAPLEVKKRDRKGEYI